MKKLPAVVFIFIFLILSFIFISPKNVHAVTGELIINSSTGIITSPIYYDNANTAYYLDPATTGTSLTVAGSVGPEVEQSSLRGKHQDDGTSQLLFYLTNLN